LSQTNWPLHGTQADNPPGMGSGGFFKEDYEKAHRFNHRGNFHPVWGNCFRRLVLLRAGNSDRGEIMRVKINEDEYGLELAFTRNYSHWTAIAVTRDDLNEILDTIKKYIKNNPENDLAINVGDK